MVVDTADWDTTVGTNGPGQSGDPKSRYYADQFENWNKGDYFLMYFSKDKIKANAGTVLILKP